MSFEKKCITKNHCYKCDLRITSKNKSKEHIIPNFLGGKLKSEKLICQKCNSEFGETIDKELYKQLGFVADIIVNDRDRKKEDKGVIIETTSGKKAKVGINFIPKPKLYIKLPNGKEIQIIGKNEKELTKIAAKKKKELEKKYGEFRLTEFTEYPSQDKFHFKNSKLPTAFVEFGGVDYFRAIGKIILNFLLIKKRNLKVPTTLLDYVCGRLSKNKFLFIYHPTHYKIHELTKGEFSHIIHLEGEKELKAIYCYLELFNFEKFICIIDDNFDGVDFSETYSCNSITGREINKQVNIELYRHHIESLIFISNGHKKQRENSFHELEKRIEQLQIEE